jgi:hypothetical protein
VTRLHRKCRRRRRKRRKRRRRLKIYSKDSEVQEPERCTRGLLL